MSTSIIGGIAALVLGSVLAVGTGVGLVSSQTKPPTKSPGDVENIQIDYGTA